VRLRLGRLQHDSAGHKWMRELAVVDHELRRLRTEVRYGTQYRCEL
jgi:hypothetical protein